MSNAQGASGAPDDARPENSGEQSVRSVPLDTEDGGTVVIEQQNMGDRNQVGGGEFKNVGEGKSVDQAAQEQAELEAEESIESGSELAHEWGGDDSEE
jgi:hypothetical protein